MSWTAGKVGDASGLWALLGVGIRVDIGTKWPARRVSTPKGVNSQPASKPNQTKPNNPPTQARPRAYYHIVARYCGTLGRNGSGEASENRQVGFPIFLISRLSS